MPTKTDRILGYLPGTFRALPRPTAVYSVVDAFGNELLQAENSLAALMQSHWVDLADRNEDIIEDLARIASLYALAPRDDEDVEEFREHLKRYVRTFLDGTVTVQGIFRVVAEALALEIADAYSDMDTWWSRSGNEWIDQPPCGDDAATALFGVGAARVSGSPSLPARVMGRSDLGAVVDLRGGSILSWAVDGGAAQTLDLASHVGSVTAATLDEVANAINDAAGATIATQDGHHLTLSSPSVGVGSSLEILDMTGDAAPSLLGLPAHVAHGSDATSARVTGTAELSGGANLRDLHFIRLLIDGTKLVEVDCTGATPTATTLDEIRDAINAALGGPIASHDGHFLTLKSQTIGLAGSIVFQSPASADATVLLFGDVPAAYTGSDQAPAKLVGLSDLRQGVDLSLCHNVRLRIDGKSLTVDCAGANPSRTQAIEIIAAINAAVQAPVANLAGRSISVSSLQVGAAGEVAIEPDGEGDATLDVLGIAPRIYLGSAATAARISGTPDLTQHQDPEGNTVKDNGVDLGGVHLVQVAVDGGPPVVVDARSAAQDPRAVKLPELVTAFNAALGAGVASIDGSHLVLTSPTVGAASRLEISPLLSLRRRRFLSRAFVSNEAAKTVLGVLRAQATGTSATQARVEGSVDLSRGVDLRQTRYLRISIDGGNPVDIDCAAMSPRPRVALLDELVAAVNAALPSKDIASHDGRHLFLTSSTTGAGSRIAFDPARGADALQPLLGTEPVTVRGVEGTRVTFTGTIDVSTGIDLSAANHLKIGVDGAAPVEIVCTGLETAHTTANEIITSINIALGSNVATSDGKRVVLTSAKIGTSSEIEIATPAGPDATQLVLGIRPPRKYQGSDPMPARLVGTPPLTGGVNLSTARFLQIAVDGGQPVSVDCAKGAADVSHVTLATIEKSINDALAKTVASDDGTHLILTSVTVGSAGRLDLQPYTASDARQVLFGDVPAVSTGSDPVSAVIEGTVDLRAGVDLAERPVLRLAVDGDRPVDVDLAGAAPDQTFADEIEAKINAVLPGVASVTEQNHLQLNSPSAGNSSRLEVLPLRALELVEYPATPVMEQPRSVRHGDQWTLHNDGAAESDLEVEVIAPQGEGGAEIVNLSSRMRVRAMSTIRPGERLRLARSSDSGIQVRLVAVDGHCKVVPGSQVQAGPLGTQVWVPFSNARHLTGGRQDDWASLQLNNPDSSAIAILRARQRGESGDQITVSVVLAALSEPINLPPADGSSVRLKGRVLVDASGAHLVDGAGALQVLLRPGAGIPPAAYVDRAVVVEGPLYPGESTPPAMIVEEISPIYDVTLSQAAPDGTVIDESYSTVTIGAAIGDDSLLFQVNSRPSQFVLADSMNKGDALRLPRGRSNWIYLSCNNARFDFNHFDRAHFAGAVCREYGIFDVSRFAQGPPDCERTLFAPPPPLSGPTVELRLAWPRYQPGAFVLNLPSDLPERYGARFDQARFALPGNAPESFPGTVLESSVLSGPDGDPDYLVNRINEKDKGSKLVSAKFLTQPNPPLGWEEMTAPFRHPRARTLTLGSVNAAAKMYLAEQGVTGLIELSARQPGVWGNSIEVTVRRAGPARYDVTIGYAAARFENARAIALAGRITTGGEDPLPALTEKVLRPQPVGVLHAKAAGVRAEVSRDRAEVATGFGVGDVV